MAEKWGSRVRAFRDSWVRKFHSDTNVQITDAVLPGLRFRYSARTHRISFFITCKSKKLGIHKNLYLGKLTEYKSMDDLRAVARESKKQLFYGATPIPPSLGILLQHTPPKENRHHIVDTFEEYIEKYSKLYNKPRTQQTNRDLFRLHIKPVLGNMYMDEIEERHIMDAYPIWVKETSFSTANKILSLVSNFWNWCESYKYVPRKSNPCAYVRKGANEKFKPQILDINGYKALFKAMEQGPALSKCHPRLFEVIKVLALTGCRHHEITDLLISDVALDDKIIHLHDSKTGARDVKLSDAVIPILRKSIAEAKLLDSKYVFPSTTNPQQSIVNIRKAFNWSLQHANLPHMRIHDLRHSFISLGANTGQNMMAMRDAAGHSRITTTEGYTHMSDAATFTAVNNVASMICE